MIKLRRRKEHEKMNGWIEEIQNAIAYVEENLTEDLDVCDIAERAYVSAFYFQKYSQCCVVLR